MFAPNGPGEQEWSLDPSTCVAVAHWWRSDIDLGALLDSRSPGLGSELSETL
jgi:hypothetical protein